VRGLDRPVSRDLRLPAARLAQDYGLDGCRRYVGYGVLAYNLHVIGRAVLARMRVPAAA